MIYQLSIDWVQDVQGKPMRNTSFFVQVGVSCKMAWQPSLAYLGKKPWLDIGAMDMFRVTKAPGDFP